MDQTVKKNRKQNIYREINQTLQLTKLQLTNLYGLNVIRCTKNKKIRRNSLLLAFAYVILLAGAVVCMGGMAVGVISFGLSNILPAVFAFISSLLILVLTMFRSGSILFQKNFYEMLCALPVSRNAIVLSRFIRMYVENLLLSFVIMGSGMAVYGWHIRPHVSVYFMWAAAAMALPLVPMTLAVILGTVITAISSRMKYKSIVSAVLMIGFMAAYMFAVTRFIKIDESMLLGMLLNLSGTVMNLLYSIYPPAVWFGKAVLHVDVQQFLIAAAVSASIFAAAVLVVSVNYHWICRGLFRTSAKHEYKISQMTKHSVLKSLYKRELKRYFSSSVYVMNTIVGPVMGVIFSAGMFAADWEKITMITGFMKISFDIRHGIPFLIAGIFSMMPTTVSSVSMEGRDWWIIKSLPVKTKDVIDSKILLNLILDLPFYLAAEMLLLIAMKPNTTELLWLILIPMAQIPFGCVMGLAINLKFPVFDWENEAYVVKQSASAFLGMACGFLPIIILAIPGMLLSGMYQNLWNAAVCVGLMGVTWWLYRRMCRIKLEKI